MSDLYLHRRNGTALRAYQIIGVLLIGWVLGRLPQIWSDHYREERRLFEALGVGPAKASGTPAGVVDINNVAAQVATQVATQVANNTIAQLIASGWGPRSTDGETVIIREIHLPPTGSGEKATPRPTDNHAPPQRFAGLDYQLPPGTVAAPVATSPSPNPSPQQNSAAHTVASEGYAALAAGNKRKAVSLLKTALRLDPDAPQADNWQADVQRLTKRWSISAYTLSRGAGTGDALAASPVLGAGQSGAAFTYTFDPLARRPLSAIARITAAAGRDGAIDNETAEAALGLRVQPLAGLPVAIDLERRIALGYYGRNAWAARVSGGTATSARALGHTLQFEAYGEAGLVDFRSSDIYGGFQGRAATPFFSTGRMSIDAGAGMWAASQRSFGTTVSRFDVGPSMRLGMHPWTFSAQLDYRLRTAGNARPASGPALTIAGQF